MKIPLVLLSTAASGLVLGAAVGFAAAGFLSEPKMAAAEQPASAGGAARFQEKGSEALRLTKTSRSQEGREAQSKTGPISLEELRQEMEEISFFFGGTGTWRRWAEVVERLKVSDIAAITEQMLAGNGGPADFEGLFIVFGVYAEKDPEGAFQKALNLPAGMLRQNGLRSVIMGVAGQDPERALTMIQSLNDSTLETQLRSMVAMVLATKDPQRALALARQNKGGGEMDFSISSIFHQWARRDLEGAKAALSELKGKEAEQAQLAIINRMAQTDPQEAWDFALTLNPTGSNTHQSPLFTVLSTWAQSDPQAAMKAWEGLPQGQMKNQALNSLIQTWSQNDFEGALQAVLDLSETNARSDVLMSMSYSRQGDPDKIFAAIIDHMPVGGNFSNAIRNVISRWAEKDPGAAAQALAELPPGQAYENGVRSLARSWAGSGSYQDALQWAKSLGNEQARASALGEVFSIWGERDSSKAVAELMSLNAKERERVAPDLARAWAARDPEAAVAWAQTFADAEERKRVIQQAVGQWSQSAPQAAAQYAMQQPAENRGALVEQIMRNWSSKDAESAAAWLAVQPAGAWRDGATSVLANSIAREDGAAGLQWAGTITDEKRRKREMNKLFRDWHRHDPDAARQWVARSNLSNEEKKSLLP